MKRKRRTLKTKYKIIFTLIFILLIFVIGFLIFNNNKKEEKDQLKIQETINDNKISNDDKNNENKISNDDKQTINNNVSAFNYDASWYTNGVLDPQKVVAKDGINLDNNLTLINKIYQVDSSYAPNVYPVDGGYLRAEAKDAYLKMKDQALANGINLIIGSSYRSYDYQKTVFNGYLANDPYSTVLTYSAYPGTSEHQTGLVIDFVEGGSCDYLECFKDTKSGLWLKDNAYKYGFILRYPKGKENITGYIFEPWHYRYVGVDNATKIHNANITLEEYLLS